jgi:hypothetical protein
VTVRGDGVAVRIRTQVVDAQVAVEPELCRKDETRVPEDQVVEAEREMKGLAPSLCSA